MAGRLSDGALLRVLRWDRAVPAASVCTTVTILASDAAASERAAKLASAAAVATRGALLRRGALAGGRGRASQPTSLPQDQRVNLHRLGGDPGVRFLPNVRLLRRERHVPLPALRLAERRPVRRMLRVRRWDPHDARAAAARRAASELAAVCAAAAVTADRPVHRTVLRPAPGGGAQQPAPARQRRAGDVGGALLLGVQREQLLP